MHGRSEKLNYFLANCHPEKLIIISCLPVPARARPAEAATYINQQIQVRNSPGRAPVRMRQLSSVWLRRVREREREAPIRLHQASEPDRTADSAWQI